MLELCEGCRANRGFRNMKCPVCCAHFLLSEPRLVVRQGWIEDMKKRDCEFAEKVEKLVRENWPSRYFRANIV